MHRVAVFVDAGHYFAAASKLAFGDRVPRRELRCDHAALVDSLTGFVGREDLVGEPARVLRTYWYDGAPNAVASTAQLEVGRLSNVKLRIGRLSGKQQKGVDGLIILDLITLARERAIDTAVLLSGDEDLREAVAAAQQFGVRVVLLGIPGVGGQGNQAESLIREADQHFVLDSAFWCPHLTKVSIPKVSAPDDAPTVEGLGEGQTAMVLDPALGTAPKVVVTVGPGDAERVARMFVEKWIPATSGDDIQKVRDARPRIPGTVDAALLQVGWEQNGHATLPDSFRKELRRAFWTVVDEREDASDDTPDSETEAGT